MVWDVREKSSLHIGYHLNTAGAWNQTPQSIYLGEEELGLPCRYLDCKTYALNYSTLLTPILELKN